MPSIRKSVVSFAAASWFASLALGGCFSSGDGSGLKVEFTTNWSDSAFHYLMTANKDLPSAFKVVVTEKETGVKQEIGSSALSPGLAGKFDVKPGMILKDGRTYRVEGFDGERSVGFREFGAHEGALAEPSEITVRASFTIQVNNVDTTPNNSSDIYLRATGVLEANPARTLFTMTGTGTANQSRGGFTARLTLTTFEAEDTDGNTTKFVMAGQGPWTASGQSSGSGQLESRNEFIGRETKMDKNGNSHLCEKDTTTVDVEGTLLIEGEAAQMSSTSTTIEWSRVDTEDVIWRKVDGTTTVTYQGQTTEEPEHTDEAVDEPAEDATLLDVVDFKGFAPSPLETGDHFRLKGLEGVTILYVASDGGTRQSAGQSFSTIKLIGTVSSGATGTETWYVVDEGALAGLPLTWTSNYQRGLESASYKAELVTLT